MFGFLNLLLGQDPQKEMTASLDEYNFYRLNEHVLPSVERKQSLMLKI